MELDCTEYNGIVKFDGFEKNHPYPIRISVMYDDEETTHYLTKYGQTMVTSYNKCVIFPKGKTTWEEFIPPCKFKDGDIVTTNTGNWIGITVGGISDEAIPTYCIIGPWNNLRTYFDEHQKWSFSRLATEEEKQKLLDIIKDNSYKWNAETKALEKLIKPKFKVGDIISNGKTTIKIGYVDDEYYYEIGKNITNRLYIKNQDDWKLVKDNIKPKFNVGDIIQNIDKYKVKITEVNIEDECYGYESIIAKGIGGIEFSEQDNWELVKDNIERKFKVGDIITFKYYDRKVDKIIEIYDDKYKLDNGKFIYFQDENAYEISNEKFDITTLKPFESKVLVRDEDTDNWKGAFYSHYKSKKILYNR